MRASLRFIAVSVTLGLAAVFVSSRSGPGRDDLALAEVGGRLDREARALESSLGAPVLIRIFKQSRTLELWLQAKARFVLFRRYPICKLSGGLGPKTKEGDEQAPEGLYQIGFAQLNPRSRFHLSLNLGYPNTYEAAQGYTGDSLMIHGDCVSIGCYAMGDPAIREIYTLVRQALEHGQRAVPVHAFPFPLTDAALQKQRKSPHYEHWRALAPAFASFEREHIPPRVEVGPRGYRVVSVGRD